MNPEYDFTDGQRGPVIKLDPSKTRVALNLDSAVLDWFREQVHKAGGGDYQVIINEVLANHVSSAKEPLENTLRRVIREELRKAG